jgi:hypothetical protein
MARAGIIVAVSSLELMLALGCSSKLPHPPYSGQPTSALSEIAFPPPPARVEMVPPRPAESGAVWLDGEWMWRSSRWAWKPGRWIIPPAGATFSPWTSTRGQGGELYYAAGAWRDAHGATVAEPAPLSVAGTRSGAVFDADGDLERTGRTGVTRRGGTTSDRDGGT